LRSLEDLISEFSALADNGMEDRPEKTGRTVSVSVPSHRTSGREEARPASGRKGNTIEAHSEEASPNASSPPAPTSRVSDNPQSGELLPRIASAVGREALESLLRRLDGARLQGDNVILEMGTSNGFLRSQIKDNLSVIKKAASDVVGRKVTVSLEESPSDGSEKETGSRAPADGGAESEILDKAKKEPVVRSFLDVFPGQVKAEKIDK